MRLSLVLLSALLSLASQGIYVWSIHKGHANPPFATRFALAIAMLLNVLSIWRAHGSLAALVFAAVAFAQTVVTTAQAFHRNGRSFRMGGFDAGCLAVSVIGAVAWSVMHNPLAGVIAAVAADFVAYLPYFRKTWRDPEPKAWPSFVLSGLGAGLGLGLYPLSATSSYQCYILAADTAFLVLNFRKVPQSDSLEAQETLAST